ncbi:cyclic nucleotide-binding domain-containing protein [Acidobacteria bacterium ACD]|nr:MAG: hypothetical protein EDX89_05920 [Acidobacteriota bacterium]MCE7957068.1 hypothetical protein [Acidobacteria bacterium ACB2]MDL1951795.1 cyclic nucleotide-binding domain-containing protein [Acidobacteria bacterium ACD]
MERQVKLKKGAYLWEAGDAARTVAVLESGRLGVRNGDALVAVLSPRAVLGETAIFALDGIPQRRTAAIVALEDDTEVAEYAVGAVRDSFQSGKSLVAPLVLTTLVGQICRSALLILAANRGRAVVELPVKGLLLNLSQTAKLMREAASWDDFYFAFGFLATLRDFADRLRDSFGGDAPGQAEAVLRASVAVGGWFAEHGLEVYVEELVRAERERESWLTGAAG